MKKIYILVVVDVNNVGYNAKDAIPFNTMEEAHDAMEKIYLDACEKAGIETPYEKGSMDYCIDWNYAYIFSGIYLDIFEKEI